MALLTNEGKMLYICMEKILHEVLTSLFYCDFLMKGVVTEGEVDADPVSLQFCIVMKNWVYLFLGTVGFASVCLGEGKTMLITKLNMKRWEPPVAMEKNWDTRKVMSSYQLWDGGRKIHLEKCENATVARRNLPLKDEVDMEGDLKRMMTALEERAPRGYTEPIMIGVSASVYVQKEERFSKVKIKVGSETCTIWSSINFLHLSGVVEYMANGRRYYEGGGSSEVLFETAKQAGCPVEELAKLGKEGFIVVEGEDSIVAHRAAKDIHTFYQVEKLQLKKAYDIYILNSKLSKEWHKANPPRPKNIKMRFWKRKINIERSGE